MDADLAQMLLGSHDMSSFGSLEVNQCSLASISYFVVQELGPQGEVIRYLCR